MIKRDRSALPLPRYVLRKISTAGVRFYFNVPAWARAQGCPLRNEPLGSDYGEAVQRAETVLLPQLRLALGHRRASAGNRKSRHP